MAADDEAPSFDPASVRSASKIDVNICKRGRVHVWLLDETGVRFAVASLKPGQVPALQDMLEFCKEQAIAITGEPPPADAIGPCEGRA